MKKSVTKKKSVSVRVLSLNDFNQRKGYAELRLPNQYIKFCVENCMNGVCIGVYRIDNSEIIGSKKCIKYEGDRMAFQYTIEKEINKMYQSHLKLLESTYQAEKKMEKHRKELDEAIRKTMTWALYGSKSAKNNSEEIKIDNLPF